MSRVLIFGVSGMLGNATFNVFLRDKNFEVFGTARSNTVKNYFASQFHKQIMTGVDVLDSESLMGVMERVKPDVIINCVGLTNKHSAADDILVALPINAMFPHRLSALCQTTETRLVHISTDCVFDGLKGGYVESDRSNATDLYGKSKHLGELHNDLHAITLRTSIIGHELNSQNALIDWFLAQTGSVRGYTRAIFSGLPTAELARIIKDYVIPRPEIYGLYHVSAAPISKFDLLSLVSDVYGKEIEIIPDDSVVIDRSLNSERFQKDSGFIPSLWPDLVRIMKDSKGD